MQTQVASGPVIIENNKVLLVKEQKKDYITPWFFPGGKKEGDETPEETCQREVMEELGIEIKIIKPLKTIELDENGMHWILYTFLAERVGEIKPADNIVQHDWHDINKLTKDCSPNVFTIIEEYKNML